MFSLYFCCRIIKSLHSDVNVSSGFFGLPPYPRNHASDDSQLDILVHSLASFANLRFRNAFINIQVDRVTEYDKSRISSAVNKSLNSEHVKLNFARSSTLNEWQAEAHSLSEQLGGDEILLVSMNHDHFYADYNPNALERAVESVFNGAASDRFGKLLCYTHAPELISNALLNGKWTQVGEHMYCNSAIQRFVDCIYIMTSSTLCYIWDSVLEAPAYLGRFDWPGVKFRDMKIERYVFLREFFRHHDGYGHITGMRLFSDAHESKSAIIQIPDVTNLKSQVDFHYQRWLDSYALFLRNSLVKSSFIPQKKPILFRRALELSLSMYKGSVLEEDARGQAGLRVFEVYVALRSKVYYNVNFIYSQILVDIELMNLSPTIVRRVAIKVFVLTASILRLVGITIYPQLP